MPSLDEKDIKWILQSFAVKLMNEHADKTASQISLRDLMVCINEFYKKVFEPHINHEAFKD